MNTETTNGFPLLEILKMKKNQFWPKAQYHVKNFDNNFEHNLIVESVYNLECSPVWPAWASAGLLLTLHTTNIMTRSVWSPKTNVRIYTSCYKSLQVEEIFNTIKPGRLLWSIKIVICFRKLDFIPGPGSQAVWAGKSRLRRAVWEPQDPVHLACDKYGRHGVSLVTASFVNSIY